ncbi:SAM-dependent methyltransferase [Nocardioides panzhihuensis]|uniref:SAM-dependent methyltransferase n=2 Tax=Nocardioides panzhihuensis TaxID=860243 RepID=A0A7Z0DRC6_9ACTN|nr:SAM-dependent methyltransferase [Nocardioides panzhihuensis]
MARFAKGTKRGMRVLDAGAGRSPYRKLFKHAQYEAADFAQLDSANPPLDYLCDITDIPVPDGHFDRVICNQVLEHVPEPEKAIAELHRVLKPGGRIFLSAPLFFAEHQKPYDFFRYTQFALRKMFEDAGFEIARMNWLEGYFGTVAYNYQMMAKNLPASVDELRGRGLRWKLAYIAPIVLLNRKLAVRLSRLYSRLEISGGRFERGMPKNYVVVARKPATDAPPASKQPVEENATKTTAQTSGQTTGQTRAELEAEVARLRAETIRTRQSVCDPLADLPLPSEVHTVLDDVRAEHLTYLKPENLQVLARQVLDADLQDRPGLIIETGAALGGSAIVMAAAKDPKRPMKVYDVFGMIPEPSERDGEDVHNRYRKIVSGTSKGIGGETYYGYRDNLYDEVSDSFVRHGIDPAQHNVELVQGLFQDTLKIDEPVAFAHLDGDWYESTMICLERIAPHLVVGGRIVLDDYFHYSGCRDAVDEYFEDRPGFRLERRTKLHAVRVAGS